MQNPSIEKYIMCEGSFQPWNSDQTTVCEIKDDLTYMSLFSRDWGCVCQSNQEAKCIFLIENYLVQGIVIQNL